MPLPVPPAPSKRRKRPKGLVPLAYPPEQLMTAEAAAAFMALSVRHVRRLIAHKVLPATRFGRAVRVSVRDVRALTRPE